MGGRPRPRRRRASPTGSIPGDRSGSTTGPCGGRCCPSTSRNWPDCHGHADRAGHDRPADGDPLDAARPPGARAHARREHVRDRHHAHRRGAGDVPRRRIVAAGPRRGGRAGGDRRRSLHHRGRGVQPRAQPRSPGLHRRLPAPGGGPARPAPDRRPRVRRLGRARRRARRDPADDPQGRPVHREHGPEPALSRPQHGVDEPARRGLRTAHQGHRRAARPPGVGDGRGVQRQLPGAPPGDARLFRQPVQHRPAARRAGARLRHQLARAVRQAAVGRDADRPVRAVGRHPAARPSSARAQRAGHVRDRLGELVGDRAVPGGHHPVPPGARPGRLRGSVRRAGRRSRPDPGRPAAAHRHGVALEPRLLRRHRRRSAPANREPRAPVRPERRRRGRQRRLLARADAGARRSSPRGQPHDAVRAGRARTSSPPPGRDWPPS